MTLAEGCKPPAEWIAQRFAEMREPLWHYVRRRVGGDAEAASDIVQEAFVKLCQQEWPGIEAYAIAWMYRTCRNQAIDFSRREGRMSTVHRSADSTDVTTLADQLQVSPADALDRLERLEALRGELERLSDQQQEILRLRLQSGLSYKQIADVLELTVTNVGYHLHTAIMTLRSRLT